MASIALLVSRSLSPSPDLSVSGLCLAAFVQAGDGRPLAGGVAHRRLPYLWCGFGAWGPRIPPVVPPFAGNVRELPPYLFLFLLVFFLLFG